MYTVEYFVDDAGNAVVDTWRRQLPDTHARMRIAMRIDYGPGYR